MKETAGSWVLRSAVWLCWLGVGLLTLTGLALLVSFVYDWIVSPTDMNLPGLLAAAAVFYLAPVGAALVAVGGLAWIALSAARRRGEREEEDAG